MSDAALPVDSPPSVTWQFFGNLNDFLPHERRKRRFRHPLKASQPLPGSQRPLSSLAQEGGLFGQTVKDALEAIGVPHPEVAVILVNGEPVDFAYQLQPGDQVKVYPHRDAPPVADEWRMPFLPPGRPRFILDVHLGALVRYLRLAGFDCLYSSQDPGDARIAELADEQGRVLLTRDVGLLKRSRVTWGYRLRNVQPKAQFRELVEHFDLRPLFDPFNRCSVCNSEDLVPLSRDEAVRHMPEGVPQAVEELWHCRECGKIYWQGSHYEGIQAFMRSV